MGHAKCLNKVSDEFRRWINSETIETERPTPDLRTLTYYYGMKNIGGESEWEKMFELFAKEQDATEKTKLQSALTAVREPSLLRRLIVLAEDETYVRKQDYFQLMASISANPIGENIVWEYVKDHWLEIVARFGLNERNLGRMIPTVTSRFTTQSKLDDLKEFFAKYPDAGAGATARIQAVEAVQNNIKWLERNQKSIGEWLSQ